MEDVLRLHSDFINHKQIRPKCLHLFIHGKKQFFDNKASALSNNSILDLQIPQSEISVFELKLYCPQCEIDIPEEMIFLQFVREAQNFNQECPNNKCKFKFTGFFGLYLFKMGEASPEQQKSQQIIPPITLQSQFRTFDFKNPTNINMSIFYMNALQYFNIFRLPGLFVDKFILGASLNSQIVAYSLDHIIIKFRKENFAKKNTANSASILVKKMVGSYNNPVVTIQEHSEKYRDDRYQQRESKFNSSTNTTDDNKVNDGSNPVLVVQQYKVRCEKLLPIIRERFTKWIYNNLSPCFDNQKNYDNLYNHFMKWCHFLTELDEENSPISPKKQRKLLEYPNHIDA